MLGGKQRNLSIKDALLESQNVRELFDQSPLVTAALHRLLLAILHRNFGPKTLEKWAELWDAQNWDAHTLIDYFKAYHGRFDLFDAKRPFYQTGEMEDATEQPVAILAQELSRGNNATIFDHSFEGSPTAFEPSVAASALVAAQAFAIGFGKSKPFYLSDSPLTRGLTFLLSGENLFATLALNLLIYDSSHPIVSRPDDAPAWEQDELAKPCRAGTVPLGYLDYLTWQSRRIHLYPEGNPPVVRRCQVQQNLKSIEVLDPFKCFVRSKEGGFRPLSLRPEKALWRDSHALFQQTDVSLRRPEVFDHLVQIDELRASGRIRARQEYSFSAFGLATEQGKAASVIMWRHERLPLPIEYLGNKPLLAYLKDAIQMCEAMAVDLRLGTRELSTYLIAPDCDLRGAVPPSTEEVALLARSFAVESRYWPRLEAPFKTFIIDLVDDLSTDNNGAIVYGAEKIPRWLEEVHMAAWNAFEETVRSLDTTARSLKAAARARTRCYRWLSKSIAIQQGGNR